MLYEVVACTSLYEPLREHSRKWTMDMGMQNQWQENSPVPLVGKAACGVCTYTGRYVRRRHGPWSPIAMCLVSRWSSARPWSVATLEHTTEDA